MNISRQKGLSSLIDDNSTLSELTTSGTTQEAWEQKRKQNEAATETTKNWRKKETQKCLQQFRWYSRGLS